MTDDEKHENQVFREKENIYRAAATSAWFTTRMERDKSLLILSSGAVGLLVTLISSAQELPVYTFVLYLISLTCFLSAIGAVLIILRRNSTYLESTIADDNNGQLDPVLTILDFTAAFSFILGAVFTVTIGILVAISKLKG